MCAARLQSGTRRDRRIGISQSADGATDEAFGHASGGAYCALIRSGRSAFAPRR